MADPKVFEGAPARLMNQVDETVTTFSNLPPSVHVYVGLVVVLLIIVIAINRWPRKR